MNKIYISNPTIYITASLFIIIINLKKEQCRIVFPKSAMEEGSHTIVLYASAEHLNTMSLLAKFISKHHPSVPVVILCAAAESAAASVAGLSSVTYRRLPSADPPPASITNPVELFFEVPRLHNPNLRIALEEISRKSEIKAFVIDFFCNAASEVSASLNIPTYFYISTGGFGVCAFLYFPEIDKTVRGQIGDLDEYLQIPGCPLIHCRDFPSAMHFRQSNTYKHFLRTAFNIRSAKGIVVNSFDALEYRAKEAISNGLCVPNGKIPATYFVGPLINDKASAGDHECLKWLDSQPRRSVVFLCFGRRGMFSAVQLKEMASGLENSGHRFLWSVRNPPGKWRSTEEDEPDLDELLPQGFLERTMERGFVIKSWAPQTEVLSHDSVGAFVTHCGRSSILEAVSFGVPMIGWPMYAEQRMMRVFMVEEMKLGLPLTEESAGFVTAAELEKRVREIMETTAGTALRHRAAEMKTAAEVAGRRGGSSVVALENFIRSLFD